MRIFKFMIFFSVFSIFFGLLGCFWASRNPQVFLETALMEIAVVRGDQTVQNAGEVKLLVESEFPRTRTAEAGLDSIFIAPEDPYFLVITTWGHAPDAAGKMLDAILETVRSKYKSRFDDAVRVFSMELAAASDSVARERARLEQGARINPVLALEHYYGVLKLLSADRTFDFKYLSRKAISGLSQGEKRVEGFWMGCLIGLLLSVGFLVRKSAF